MAKKRKRYPGLVVRAAAIADSWISIAPGIKINPRRVAKLASQPNWEEGFDGQVETDETGCQRKDQV